MRRPMLVLALATAALTGCGDSTEPGPVIDHLEIQLKPARTSYPVPDTVRASFVAISREGTWMPTSGATWRSLTPTLASVSPSGLITALGPGEAAIEVEVGGVTARVGVPIRGILHRGSIAVTQTWLLADTPHVVEGYLNVSGVLPMMAPVPAILTIEPGVTVRFRPGSGLSFQRGRLMIPSGSRSVVMEGDSAGRGSWVGISFETPGRSELRNLTLRHCGATTPSDATLACLDASGQFAGSGPELFIDGVTISDAHDGVNISHWVTIAPGSRLLNIENTDGYVASISPQVAGTFPLGGQFTGNAENAIRITNGLVEQSATWSFAGLPWRLTGGVTFAGAAEPVLVLPPGTAMFADAGGSLSFESGGLLAGAAVGAPVVVESMGAGWGGIGIAHGEGSALRNVTLRDCGSAGGGCLRVDAADETDTGIVLENVTIRGARHAGIRFGTWGHFSAGSHGISIRETAGVPLDVGPEGVTSIPTGDYAVNDISAIRVRGGLVWRTETWRNLGVAYLLPDGVLIESSTAPPTLTLDPGVVVRLGLGMTFAVGIGSLQAVGTAANPIVFTSVTPGVPGSWMGIELRDWDTPSMRLDHVEIADAGAGPAGFAGALRLNVDPGGVLRNSVIRRSPSCGVILLGGAWAEDYTAPASGNQFVDVAGPARCRP